MGAMGLLDGWQFAGFGGDGVGVSGDGVGR